MKVCPTIQAQLLILVDAEKTTPEGIKKSVQTTLGRLGFKPDLLLIVRPPER